MISDLSEMNIAVAVVVAAAPAVVDVDDDCVFALDFQHISEMFLYQ